MPLQGGKLVKKKKTNKNKEGLGPNLAILRGQVKVISGAKLILVFYSGFRRFFAHSVIILCFLPVMMQFLINYHFFTKKGCKNWVFQVSVFWFEFFLTLLKHNKTRGFKTFLCSWLLNEKKRTKNDNWNFWIGIFGVRKWPFRDA